MSEGLHRGGGRLQVILKHFLPDQHPYAALEVKMFRCLSKLETLGAEESEIGET